MVFSGAGVPSKGGHPRRARPVEEEYKRISKAKFHIDEQADISPAAFTHFHGVGRLLAEVT